MLSTKDLTLCEQTQSESTAVTAPKSSSQRWETRWSLSGLGWWKFSLGSLQPSDITKGFVSLNSAKEPGLVRYTNPSIVDAETRGSKVQGYPKLHVYFFYDCWCNSAEDWPQVVAALGDDRTYT